MPGYEYCYTENEIQQGQAVKIDEDGMIQPLTKPTTYRSKEYKAFVCEHRCLGCESFPTEPHHVPLGAAGKGVKAPDSHCVPLCRICHDRLHTGGEKTFWNEVNIDPQRVIIRLLTEWLQRIENV